MPELPEVERVRRELADRLVGARLARVRVARRDVVSGATSASALLQGDEVRSLERYGKQLAIVGSSGRAISIHLGMSGQLFWVAPRHQLPRSDHVHLTWTLASQRGRMVFRDPRRFGGIWTFPSMEQLREDRWSSLGPDALTISARALRSNLHRSSRAIKAAILDQSACAGVGNIYADEALFGAQIHPLAPCTALDDTDWRRLAREIRLVLRRALKFGGSSIRNYVGGDGVPGGYQRIRQVYGRGGLPCRRCGTTLHSALIAQRTSVWCPGCQVETGEPNHKLSTSGGLRPALTSRSSSSRIKRDPVPASM